MVKHCAMIKAAHLWYCFLLDCEAMCLLKVGKWASQLPEHTIRVIAHISHHKRDIRMEYVGLCTTSRGSLDNQIYGAAGISGKVARSNSKYANYDNATASLSVVLKLHAPSST
jgi:hypothetical protein